MGDSPKSLNPSLPDTISQWLRPDWSRTVLARRIAAGALVVLAGVAALRPDPDGDRAHVVVAARDLSPGNELTAMGRRLAESAAGPDARIVPVHPADTALIDLVRPGDVVDVVAASENSSQANPHVVATDAIVVSVSAQQKAQTATNDRVVLVALPATSANAVAGAALVQTVTLTLH